MCSRLLSVFARRCSSCSIVLYLWLSVNIATCAVIQKTNSSLLQYHPECTKSGDWLGHTLQEEDCSATVNMLYRIETLKHGMNAFEFLGKGATPETKFPVMATPRRYTFGKPFRGRIIIA